MTSSDSFQIRTESDGSSVMDVFVDGFSLLRGPITNKGTAFTAEERIALRLEGLLPPAVQSLSDQVVHAYAGYRDAPTDIAKYQFLRALQDRQETLFFALLREHLEEMLPIVYTPTVGEAVRRFHALYQSPRGLSLSTQNIGRAEAAVLSHPFEDVRMIVATDSSAILGIGDQGYGGLAICIGKLALYTAGGGVAPWHTMPAVLDVGTERADLVDDVHYLGVREKRLRGDAYFAFLDAFVSAVRQRFPRAVLQWEDLAKDTAFAVLDRFRKVLPSFNDDIQGTGAVALAGVLNACRLRGERLQDQRIIVHGAGAGGIGVAWAIVQGLIRDGLDATAATSRVFVLDSKGLLTTSRAMEGYKRPFAQPPDGVADWRTRGEVPTLLETIENAKATVLLGLSGQPGAFDEDVAVAMAKNTARPVIFPLSNPTSSAEARPEDLIAWTNGEAIVATGSPFAPVSLGHRTFVIGQGNNAFVFPGLGLGAIVSRANEITDGMVLCASYALAEYSAERHGGGDSVYPPVSELAEVSRYVAARVARVASEEGVAEAPVATREEAEDRVRAAFWDAQYLPTVRR